jgi:integrative and conjugative element protein (TIGR02256 family)
LKLVYRVTQHQRLIIVEYPLQQMLAFAQHRCGDCEAGGVLLGRHLLDSCDVVVDEVTTPQSSDRRDRFSFFRSSKHELEAHKRWVEEKNTMAYLGLWHTHPEPDPSPSSVDRRDWIQAVSRDTFEGPRLFFPIIGTRSIGIWTLNRQGNFRKLKLENENGDEEAYGTS